MPDWGADDGLRGELSHGRHEEGGGIRPKTCRLLQDEGEKKRGSSLIRCHEEDRDPPLGTASREVAPHLAAEARGKGGPHIDLEEGALGPPLEGEDKGTVRPQTQTLG